PTPAAPVGTTTSAPAPAAASVPLGTMLLRNWPVVLIALIVLAGLGLWVFARGGERKEEWPPAAETTPLKETPKTELPAREPVATQPAAPVATTAAGTPAVVAPLVTPAHTKRQKGKKGKKARQRREAEMAAAAPPITQEVV